MILKPVYKLKKLCHIIVIFESHIWYDKSVSIKCLALEYGQCVIGITIKLKLISAPEKDDHLSVMPSVKIWKLHFSMHWISAISYHHSYATISLSIWTLRSRFFKNMRMWLKSFCWEATESCLTQQFFYNFYFLLLILSYSMN